MARHTDKNNDFFQDFFPSLFNDSTPFWSRGSAGNRPNFLTASADIQETDQSYTVRMDLPGFDKQDIHIDYDKDVLTLTATRSSEVQEKNDEGQYIRQERSYGSIHRQFYLKDVQEENIHAAYKDGVLSVQLPKKAQGSSKKKISID